MLFMDVIPINQSIKPFCILECRKCVYVYNFFVKTKPIKPFYFVIVIWKLHMLYV